MKTKERIQDLSNICTASGLIMKGGQNSFCPIKLALEPYILKRPLYQQIGQISKVWQKLLYEASKDTELIKRTFSQVIKVDEMIEKLFRIYLRSCEAHRDTSLVFCRTDFFKNSNEEVKIIEYNLTSVSMASHSQNFSKAMKLSQVNVEPELQNQFLSNSPCSAFIESICQLYRLKGLKGLFLMVVGSKQKNVIDQTLIQIKLLEKGIRTKRQNLCTLYYRVEKKENKLFYENEQISMVYYRTGYQPSDYCENGKHAECWQARQMIQTSDAIKIPDIKMELMNQKRMQVQLSKESVHSKYLTQSEAKILRKSLVFTVDFEHNPQGIDYVKLIEKQGIQNFILKPNLQGGGNNIYGKNAYESLKAMSQSQRKKYILMQKIDTQSVQNTLFLGTLFQTQKCICQISRYGIISQIDGKLNRNSCDGYLVRIKPETAEQGGVMAGVGAIAAMAYAK